MCSAQVRQLPASREHVLPCTRWQHAPIQHELLQLAACFRLRAGQEQTLELALAPSWWVVPTLYHQKVHYC